MAAVSTGLRKKRITTTSIGDLFESQVYVRRTLIGKHHRPESTGQG